MSTALLRVSDLTVRFGGVTSLRGVSCSVGDSEVVALIGSNGAGKSTFINCVAGFVRPQSGQVLFDELDLRRVRPHRFRGLGIARTFQNLSYSPALTAMETILVGAHGLKSTARGALARQSIEIGELLGIAPVLEKRMAELPYGTVRLIEIARAFVGSARLILLDEPAAGLHPAEKDALVNHIRELWLHGGRPAIVVVEHDMAVIKTLAERVFVLESGSLIACGTYDEVVNDSRVVEAYLGTGIAGDISGPGRGG